MSLIGEAFVRIRPDDTGFKAEATKQVKRDLAGLDKSVAFSNRELGRFSRGALVGTGALGGLGRAAAFASASFIGGAGIVAGLKSASEAASNLNEQTSKSAVVFGKSQDAIVAWSKNSAQALGLANDQAIQAAAGFGALLRPLGETEQAAADNSKRLTQLAADLASFSNTSVSDALQALSSGLVGEIEPLRRYGVVLSETAVQQKALQMTGKDAAKELTNQEKVAARLALIFTQTSQAQGDFARTSGGLANQQRILSANLRNLSATVGEVVNPVLLDAITKLNKFLADPANQKRIQGDIQRGAEVTKNSVGILARTFKGASDVVHTFADALNSVDHALGGGKPNRDDAQKALEKEIQSYKQLIDLQKASIAAQNERNPAQGLDIPLTSDVNIPSRVKGHGFVGRPLTPAEQLGISLAARPDDVSALKAQRDQYQRALDFAKKQVADENGNTKQWAKDIETLTGEITGITDHLATIASDNAQKAADARQKIIDANKKAAQQRLDAANALTSVPTRLDIQGQIVAANSTSDVQQIPILEREAAAVQKNIATLRKTAQFKTQQLQAELTLANINKQIRDIRSQAAQTAADAAKQAQAAAAEAAQKARDAAQARFDALVAETEAEKVASLQVQIQEQRSKNEKDLLGPLNVERQAAEAHLKVLQKIGASQEDQYQEILHIESVKRRIRDIQGQADASSAQALFSEAGKALAGYGSNVSGFDLSVQDAGGAAIRAAMGGPGTSSAVAPVSVGHLTTSQIRAAQKKVNAYLVSHGRDPITFSQAAGNGGKVVHITQNFIGARDAGQAIQEASNAARALRN